MAATSAPIRFVPTPCNGTADASAGLYWQIVSDARTCLAIGALDTAVAFIEALRVGVEHWPAAVTRRARPALDALDEALLRATARALSDEVA